MRKTALFLTGFLTVSALSFAPAPSYAADPVFTATPAPMTTTAAIAAPTFTDPQRVEIESIIKEYLTDKHPEVMAQGLELLQKREQDASDSKSKQAVQKARDRIYDDVVSPVGGNPKGDVTVVEFFDYQCGYCKMSEDSVEHLLKDDKNVKFIYKEFPILGPASADAAKASLASAKQGKYKPFHDALMAKKEHLTTELIMATAKDVGLDMDKLKKDMADASVTDEIASTLKLGQDIGVRGTPMFIINDNVYPGAMQPDQLKQAVSDARNPEKKS
jgi:protein-disulfide isomerase